MALRGYGRVHGSLHRLSGKGADPARTPTENARAKQRSKEAWDGILKPTTHHANAGEDQSAEADDSTGIYGKCLEATHERRCSREVHRSLCVGNTSECKRNEGGSHRSSNAANRLASEVRVGARYLKASAGHWHPHSTGLQSWYALTLWTK